MSSMWQRLTALGPQSYGVNGVLVQWRLLDDGSMAVYANTRLLAVSKDEALLSSAVLNRAFGPHRFVESHTPAA